VPAESTGAVILRRRVLHRCRCHHCDCGSKWYGTSHSSPTIISVSCVDSTKTIQSGQDHSELHNTTKERERERERERDRGRERKRGREGGRARARARSRSLPPPPSLSPSLFLSLSLSLARALPLSLFLSSNFPCISLAIFERSGRLVLMFRSDKHPYTCTNEDSYS